jgi:hypothetical protein
MAKQLLASLFELIAEHPYDLPGGAVRVVV